MSGWVAVPVDVLEALIELATPGEAPWPVELVHADLLLHQNAALALGRRWPAVRKFADRWRWSRMSSARKLEKYAEWSDGGKLAAWKEFLGSLQRSGVSRSRRASVGTKQGQSGDKRNGATPKVSGNAGQKRDKAGTPLGKQTPEQSKVDQSPSTLKSLHPPASERHLPGQGQDPSRSPADPAAQTARDGTSPPASASSSAEVDVEPLQAVPRPAARAAQAAAGLSEAQGQAAQLDPSAVSAKVRSKGNTLPLTEHARRAIEAAATLAELDALRRGDRVVLAALRVVIRASGGPASFRLRELEPAAAEAADMTVLFGDGRGLADLAYGRKRRKQPRPGGAVARGAAPALGGPPDLGDVVGLLADGFRADVEQGAVTRHAAAIAAPLDDQLAFEDACDWLARLRWALDHDVDELRDAAADAARAARAAGLDVRTVRP